MLESRVLNLQKSLQSATKLNEMNKEYLKKLSEGEHIVFFPLILDERTICEQAKTNIKYLIFAQTEINQQ